MVLPVRMTSGIRSKVGPKGQAVIPKPIRDALGIRPGDDVVFTGHGGHAHVQKTGASADEAWADFLATAPPGRATKMTPAQLKRDLQARLHP
ncbi:MAG: AbrB/MazE/SpoVT family DNA-binding domain-containing protein [Thermoplasmatota archaeon]|nr:AbrB/MazE/SpoVT family DNA-binding domain-containing protein [Halobacteriales archaeon]